MDVISFSVPVSLCASVCFGVPLCVVHARFYIK